MFIVKKSELQNRNFEKNNLHVPGDETYYLLLATGPIDTDTSFIRRHTQAVPSANKGRPTVL